MDNKQADRYTAVIDYLALSDLEIEFRVIKAVVDAFIFTHPNGVVSDEVSGT